MQSDGTAVSSLNTGPKVSGDGKIVVFDAASDPLDPANGVVMIRDRASRTTTVAPDVPSLHPAVSGDGCVVAYSTPNRLPDQIDLVAFNRCTSGAEPERIATVPIPDGSVESALPAPALSDDGAVIVWSTGLGVARYTKPASTWSGQTIVVPAEVVPSATIVAPVVDISANGATIVFAAGPGNTPFAPTRANVFRWTAGGSSGGTVDLLSASASSASATTRSTAPSISADGRFVVYQSDDVGLLAASKPTTPGPLGTFVVLFDDDPSSTAPPTAKVVAADGERPVISGDGSTIAYDTNDDVRRQRSVGATPFSSVTEVSLSAASGGTLPTDPSVSGPSVSGPVLTANGKIGIFDSIHLAALTGDPAAATGTHVFARTIDDTPTTTTQPTTPPTTPTTPAPTTAPPTTSPSTTTPPTTIGPPETTIPASTVPNRPPTATTVPPYRPPATSGTGSSGSSSRPVGSSSTVTYASPTPVAEVAFVPVAVDFSPTIVGAGRQTTTFSITNPTAQSVEVIDLSIGGDTGGAFSIVENGCESASIPAGGTCTVVVAFAPVAIGSTSATITAILSNGDTAGAMLGGTGAPPPTLTVVPGVASSGQVVTVQGSGFPAGIAVSLTWLGDAITEPIQTDANGSFVETLLVLPRTPRGPSSAVVAGQTDQFSTVVGDVLIAGTSDRSSSVLTHSAGSPFGS